MEMTVVNKYIGEEVVGYVVLTRISSNGQIEIAKIQERIVQKFHDAIYCLPKDSLHITLMDWISPFADYDKDKDLVFDEIFSSYNQALEKAITDKKLITVKFNTIEVSCDAIILIGEDGGDYNEIRERFVVEADFVENAKKPPKIVHTTICRFLKEIPISEIKTLVREINVDIIEKIDGFELVRTSKSPLLEFSVIKKYEL